MRRLVAAALAFATIALVQRLFAMVFVLNFDVAGPNITAALAALLITAPAWFRAVRPMRQAATIVALAGITVASLATGALATAGAAVGLLAMGPLWRAMGPASMEGAALGALAWMTVTSLAGGLSPFHIMPWLVPVLGLPIVGWLWLEAQETPAPATLGIFLMVQAVWLAALPSLWRWADVSPAMMTLAAAGGLAVGLVLRGQAWPKGTSGAVFVVGAAWSLGPWAPWLGVLAAQVACVQALGRGGGIGRLAIVQSLAVVFLFMHAVAGNWAFVGFVPETLSRGLAGVYMFLVLALLPVATWRRA